MMARETQEDKMAATFAVPRRNNFRGALALVAYVTISLLLTQSAVAQTRDFQSSGTAEIGSDSLGAREKACANGTRLAVESAIKWILDQNSVNANRRDIDDILAGANRYARRNEILQEGPSDREYRCRVRVTVDTKLLTSDLRESFPFGQPLGRRIMVIIDEYRLDRPALPSTRTATEKPAEGNAPASLRARDSARDSEFRLKYKELFPDLPH